MALSEQEQQLLDEMEQALYAEDPRFASQMKAVARRSSYTRHAIGGVGLLGGLGLILLGVNTNWIIGAVGFVLMVAALAFAFATPRRKPGLGTVSPEGTVRPASPKSGRKGPRDRGSSGSFMQRMEARWDRRKGGGGW